MIKFLRACKTSLQYVFRNFGLSFASIVVMTLSFFIVSIVGLAFYGSLKVVEHLDSKPSLKVYLRGSLNDEEKQEAQEIIETTDTVREVSVKDLKFSEDQYYQNYPDLSIEGTISDEDKAEAFPLVTFVYADTQEDLKQVIEDLEGNERFMKDFIDQKNIDLIGWYSFDNELADAIRDTNTILQRMGLIITALLFVISSILIFITIKLTIQYHAKELEIMELVGADWWFIRLPFVLDGIIYGLIGGFLSTGIIFMFKNYVTTSSQELVPTLKTYFAEVPWPTLDTQLVTQIFIYTAIAGGVVGFLSSLFAIIRYMKKTD